MGHWEHFIRGRAMAAPNRMTITDLLGCTIEEASEYDPRTKFDLTERQRAMLAEAAAAEYRYAANSILEPYGYVLTGDGQIVRSDAEEDSIYTWDEETVRQELSQVRVPWTLALARATSAHNALLTAETASAQARAARDDAVVNAAQTGAGAYRIAEATGAAESEVNRIIFEALR
jgi:hypothetical protein